MALEQIKDIHEKGGTVESLISFCGGLPGECIGQIYVFFSDQLTVIFLGLKNNNKIFYLIHCLFVSLAPEFSNNPLRYKFSWSPRAVLANTLSPARYMNQNQIVEICGGGE